MAYNDGRTAVELFPKGLEEFVFRTGVQGARRLVQEVILLAR